MCAGAKNHVQPWERERELDKRDVIYKFITVDKTWRTSHSYGVGKESTWNEIYVRERQWKYMVKGIFRIAELWPVALFGLWLVIPCIYLLFPSHLRRGAEKFNWLRLMITFVLFSGLYKHIKCVDGGTDGFRVFVVCIHPQPDPGNGKLKRPSALCRGSFAVILTKATALNWWKTHDQPEGSSVRSLALTIEFWMNTNIMRRFFFQQRSAITCSLLTMEKKKRRPWKNHMPTDLC